MVMESHEGGLVLGDWQGVFCEPQRPGNVSGMGEAFGLLAQASGTHLLLLQTPN